MSREVDVLVAQHVMPIPRADSEEGALDVVPPYSTEIAAAWQIVTATSSEHGRGWFWSLRMGVGDEAEWAVQITSTESGRIQVEADTAELAICRAALLAVGVTPP